MITRRPMRYSHTEGHTDVCYSGDGKYIITCGHDGDIRVWCGLEDDDPNSQCVGETAFAVAFKGRNLYVATDSNKVQAYTFPELEKDGIVCNLTAPVTHIAVSQDGDKVVSGSRDMTIQICDKSSSEYNNLSGHAAPVLGVSVDPNLEYVASSSCDGTIRIWSIKTLKCVNIWSCLPECNSFSMAKCLGRTSWHPISGKCIAVPDDRSIDLYKRDTWEKMTSLSDDRVQKTFSIALFSPCGQYLAASTVCGEICIWDVKKDVCVSYTEHQRQYAITAMAWNPTNNGTIAFCDATGQLGTLEGCIPDVSTEENTEDNLMSLDTHDDEDNENVISIEKIKSSVSQPLLNLQGLDIDALSTKEDDAESKASFDAPSYKIQPPFQPSSSPMNLMHRYMVWNSVGIIRCFNTEEENSIDVEFHDSALHHAIHINNYLKHTLASLSETALLLACEADSEAPSKIVCVLLNSWDGTREWSMELPEGEEVLAVACSKNWLAVATDKRNLRFFTIAGAQREIVSLPGPIVCLAAQDNLLLVVFHHGPGMNFNLLAVERLCIETLVSFHPVPLTPEASLQWAGFSDESTPCIMDSAGVIRILSTRGYWLPLCDTLSHRKGMSDNYFIVGVSEKYQNVRCILCKGSRYPPTTPRPTVVELSMKVPLCDASSEKSNLEEIFWRNQILFDTLDNTSKIDISYAREKENAEKTIKETIIKLFALACRSGLEQRAVDLCKLMPSTQIMQLAMKYASKLGKNQLVERIGGISSEARSIHISHLTETHPRFIASNKFSLYKRGSVKENESKNVEDTDPFASSQDSHTEKENILLNLKEKMNSSVTVQSSVSQRKVNPFKKNAKAADASPVADANGSKDTGTEDRIQNRSSSSSATVKIKQTGLWGKTPNLDQPSNKGPKFIHWYNKEKENLQKEFPDLDTAALTRLGLKRFKEDILKKSAATKTKENTQTSSSENSRPSSENSQTSDSDVLTISTLNNTPSGPVKECAAEKIDNAFNESENNQETKKRKLNEDGISQESSASKLAKFAFKNK